MTTKYTLIYPKGWALELSFVSSEDPNDSNLCLETKFGNISENTPHLYTQELF